VETKRTRAVGYLKGAPVAIVVRVRPHDQGGDVDLAGLNVDGQSVGIGLGQRLHAIVAHEGIGQHEDLALVRGVGERLVVPDHAFEQEGEGGA